VDSFTQHADKHATGMIFVYPFLTPVPVAERRDHRGRLLSELNKPS
jgi:hypothetical protein